MTPERLADLRVIFARLHAAALPPDGSVRDVRTIFAIKHQCDWCDVAEELFEEVERLTGELENAPKIMSVSVSPPYPFPAKRKANLRKPSRTTFEMFALHQRGSSLREIGLRYDINSSSVWDRLKSAGLHR